MPQSRILLLCIYIVCVAKGNARSYSSYLNTNEIFPTEVKKAKVNSVCESEAICGFLQANTRGISQQIFCNCPRGFPACPIEWDPYDGHSITQGSDQYKFCGPPPPISKCKASELAYSSRTLYKIATEDIITKSERLHCICPEDHKYSVINQAFGDVGKDLEAVEISYECDSMAVCDSGAFCKVVTEKPGEFLVNPKCLCPKSAYCPTEPDEGSKSMSMGSGKVHLIRCQH